MSDIELADYQAKLREGCHLSIEHRDGEWVATVVTDHNQWPYWQQGRASSPGAAWRSLKAFLDGGPQIHGRRLMKSSDFIKEG